MDFDSILKGEQPETEKPERARDESGKFTKSETVEVKAEAPEKEEPKPEPPKAEPLAAKEPKEAKDPQTVPVKALQEERRKRQELEQRLQEMERKSTQKPPDVLENPEQYQQHVSQQIQHQIINERMNTSEVIAREKYGDEEVDEAQTMFQEAAQRDPTLGQRLLTEKNPYGWLIRWKKNQKFMAEVGEDPQEYLSKKEQALREQIRAELEAQYAHKPRPAAPPPSLASSAGVAPRSETWAGPLSLDQILKR